MDKFDFIYFYDLLIVIVQGDWMVYCNYIVLQGYVVVDVEFEVLVMLVYLELVQDIVGQLLYGEEDIFVYWWCCVWVYIGMNGCFGGCVYWFNEFVILIQEVVQELVEFNCLLCEEWVLKKKSQFDS